MLQEKSNTPDTNHPPLKMPQANRSPPPLKNQGWHKGTGANTSSQCNTQPSNTDTVIENAPEARVGSILNVDLGSGNTYFPYLTYFVNRMCSVEET